MIKHIDFLLFKPIVFFFLNLCSKRMKKKIINQKSIIKGRNSNWNQNTYKELSLFINVIYQKRSHHFQLNLSFPSLFLCSTSSRPHVLLLFPHLLSSFHVSNTKCTLHTKQQFVFLFKSKQRGTQLKICLYVCVMYICDVTQSTLKSTNFFSISSMLFYTRNTNSTYNKNEKKKLWKKYLEKARNGIYILKGKLHSFWRVWSKYPASIYSNLKYFFFFCFLEFFFL